MAAELLLPDALDLADIDWDDPLLDHPLNEGLVEKWLVLPGHAAGTTWYGLKAKTPGTLTGFTSGYGWSPQSYPGGAGSLNCNGSMSAAAYVDYGLAKSLMGIGEVSASVWVNGVLGNGGDYPHLWGIQEDADVNTPWALWYWNAGEEIFWTVSNGSSYANVTIRANLVLTGSWHQLLGTYDGSEAHLYLDGALQGSASLSGTITTVANHLQLGAYTNTADHPNFNGFLTNATAWARALSAAEAAAVYRNDRSGNPGVLRRRGRVAYSVPSGGTSANIALVPASFAFASPLPTVSASANVSLNSNAATFDAPPVTVSGNASVAVSAADMVVPATPTSVTAGANIQAVPGTAVSSGASVVVSGNATTSLAPPTIGFDAAPVSVSTGTPANVLPCPTGIIFSGAPVTVSGTANAQSVPSSALFTKPHAIPSGSAATSALPGAWAVSKAAAAPTAGAAAIPSPAALFFVAPAVSVFAQGSTNAPAYPGGLVFAACPVTVSVPTRYVVDFIGVEPARPLLGIEPARPFY